MGKVGRIYYATQASVRPPTVVCFVNEPKCFTADYRRYLVNQLQAAGAFPEVPVRLRVRERRRRDAIPDGALRRPRGDPDDYTEKPIVFEVPLGDGPEDGDDVRPDGPTPNPEGGSP